MRNVQQQLEGRLRMKYRFEELLSYAAFAFIAMYTVTVPQAAQSSTSKGFSLLPSNITARVMFPARFDCQPTAGFIRWAVEDDIMLNNSSCSGCVLLGNSSLYFPSVTQDHAGRYTCFIIGVLGPTPRYSVYLTVAEAPRIASLTPATVTIIQNETLEINVDVTGVPRPNVTWRKDNKNLNDDLRFIITGANLILSNAQPIDAGEYTITAHNIADTEVEHYNIIVQFPPIITITRNPDSNMVDNVTMVTVTCMITSNPQSRISWEQITLNDRTDRTDRANTPTHSTNSLNTVSLSTITFTDEDINGFSTFCCSASNDIGIISSCLNFTETGTPLMPTKLRLTSTTSSSANVSWESSTTGLGIICELSWYIDGGLVNSTILPSDMMSYRIEGLEANTEYELRINAINTQTNKSSATASITVSTLVAAPGPVLNFTVDVLKTWNTIQVTWMAPKESKISHYMIYIKTINNLTVLMVPGTSTSHFYNYQENIMYEFAIQAVNVGGSGPVSNYITVFHCSTDVLLGVSYVPYGYSVNILWNSTKIINIKKAYLVVEDNSDGKYIFPFIFSNKTSLCISNLVPNSNYFINILVTFDCINMTKVVTESVNFTTPPADGSSLMQDCIKYEIPEQNKVSSNSHSVTSAIIGGTMGSVILLLTITVVLCAGVLYMNRTRDVSTTDHYSSSYDDTLNYGLYSTIKPIELNVITTNRSYNIPTKPYSKSNEDEYTYLQPDQCIQPSDLEDDIKMDTNPSYGINTIEDRVTDFNTTAADSDTSPHQSSQQDDYDDVIAITNNDGIEENNARIHTIVDQSAKPAGKDENDIDDQSQNDGPKQHGDGFWYTDV